MTKSIQSSDGIPVTKKMLYGVRDELNSKFLAHDKRFDQLEAKIDSNHERLMAEIHRVVFLVEEQKNQNRFVMDGLTNLFERQARIEKLVGEK